MKGVIVGFNKKTQELIVREEVNITLNALRQIFKPYADDPEMVMVYNVDADAATKLKSYTSLVFNFEENVYEFDTPA